MWKCGPQPPLRPRKQAIYPATNHKTMTRHSTLIARKAHFAQSNHYGARAGPSSPRGHDAKQHWGQKSRQQFIPSLQLRQLGSIYPLPGCLPFGLFCTGGSDLQEPISTLELPRAMDALLFQTPKWTPFCGYTGESAVFALLFPELEAF